MPSDSAKPEDIEASLTAAANRLRGFTADPSMATDPGILRREPNLGRNAGPTPDEGMAAYQPARPESADPAAGPNRFQRIFGRRQAEQPDLLAGMVPLPQSSTMGEDRPSSGRRWRNRAMLAVILGGLLIGLSFLYFGGNSGGEPVLIAADPTPEKIKPEDPGGLQVPNQNSTLLNNQAGLPSGNETVLPPEEQPAPLIVEAPSLSAAAPAMPAAPAVPAAPAIPAMPEVPMVAAPPVAGNNSALPQPQPLAPAMPEAPALIPASVPATPAAPDLMQPAIDQTAAAPMAAAPEPLPAALQPAPGGTLYVQLAAVKSETAARKEWAKLQRKYPELLGALDLRMQAVDKGAEGIFVRVQAGPLADKSTAKALCGQLKAANQACILAK